MTPEFGAASQLEKIDILDFGFKVLSEGQRSGIRQHGDDKEVELARAAEAEK